MKKFSLLTKESPSWEESTEEEEGCAFTTASSDRRADTEAEAIPKQVQCLVFPKRRSVRTEFSSGKTSWWRQGSKATRMLEKQLQARWRSEELIEKQLQKFLDQYRCVSAPIMFKDVSELLMPDHIPPPELATVTWLGDWRPSAMLELVHELAFPSSSSVAFGLSDPSNADQKLSQLISDVRIEEAIIDSELTEIQCNCITIPFSSSKNRSSRPSLFHSMQTEFQKLGKVVEKAQLLRFKTLNAVVKTLLSKTGAAEFLVAFVGIQSSIRRAAMSMEPREPFSPSLPWDRTKLLSQIQK